jgi:hypothetical protein
MEEISLFTRILNKLKQGPLRKLLHFYGALSSGADEVKALPHTNLANTKLPARHSLVAPSRDECCVPVWEHIRVWSGGKCHA